MTADGRGVPIGTREAAHTCGWPACEGCAAVRRFMAKWEAGEITPRQPITSPWWESAEADAFYERGVNLPPCQHREATWP